MRLMRIARPVLAVLASVAFLLPRALSGGEPAAPQRGGATTGLDLAIRDVALQREGGLEGQVLDPQGTPVGNAVVAASQNGKLLAVVRTDSQGGFTFPRLRAGVYHVATRHTGGLYRVWTADAAPPAATHGVLLVDGPAVVRGDLGAVRNVSSLLTNPLVLGVLVAAIIAYPLATDSDDAS